MPSHTQPNDRMGAFIKLEDSPMFLKQVASFYGSNCSNFVCFFVCSCRIRLAAGFVINDEFVSLATSFAVMCAVGIISFYFEKI